MPSIHLSPIGDDDGPKTIRAPRSDAELAFENAARKAQEARRRYAAAIRRHPSVRLALREVEAALADVEAARKRVPR